MNLAAEAARIGLTRDMGYIVNGKRLIGNARGIDVTSLIRIGIFAFTCRLVDGSVVDILADNSVNSDGEYFYDFSEYGTYSVVLEAEDELGNATGEIKYEINIKEKPLDALKRVFSTEDGEGGTKFNYKKAAIIGGGSLAGVALIATCVVFLIRRKRIR